MALTSLEIKTRVPFAQGNQFGEVGPYEQIDGIAHFSVDPNHPNNSLITDLELAPRDSAGRVVFSSDFRILRPIAAGRGNHRLLFDVVNRGNQMALRLFNDVPPGAVPTAPLEPGNGFLMRQGFTVASCGWQHDIPEVPGLIGIHSPTAANPANPISGKIAFSFHLGATSQVQSLADRMHRPYPSSSLDGPDAVLTVQDNPAMPPQAIPRDKWAFARMEDGQIKPDDSNIYMAAGFDKGKSYRLIYSTNHAPLVGLGHLATRDFVSFLRYRTSPEDNPCAGDSEYALAFGASQSGRFLREFLYLALNEDEENHTIFDGLIPHIAGGRRGEFNQRFGQPSSTDNLSTGNLFPFADVVQTDSETGNTDGLLSRMAAKGQAPKLFFTHSSWEYWRGDASLGHIDMDGTHDLSPSESVRIYHFAGTQHGSGTYPPTNTNAATGDKACENFNWVDYRPLLRNALVRLDRWVNAGELPPPSRHPRLDDGTAVSTEHVSASFRAIPNIDFPEHLPNPTRLDFGPEVGIPTKVPPSIGKSYSYFVPGVDQDGNELGGIRLPDLSVPIATNTGWNLRHPDIGGHGQILEQIGSTLPFPVTRSQREESGDPRLSLEERYSSMEDYLGQVRRAAEISVGDGYLLADEIEGLIAQAAQRYELLQSAIGQAQLADD